MAESQLVVVLCWSLAPRDVKEIRLQVPVGSTVQNVLDRGIAQCLGDAPATAATVPCAGRPEPAQFDGLHCLEPGIWGKKVPWTHLVKADDRIELYRPLKVDPKVARRQRFKRQGKGRTGLFANRKSGSAAGY